MAEQIVAEVEYRDIPGFEGYRVGSDGSVWTCRRTRSGMTDTWRQMKCERRQLKSGNAYVFALLRIDRKSKAMAVHRLVLMAFVGPCPIGKCACHANDNGEDNRIANLRWDTMQANMRDRSKNKRTAVGENTNRNKLSESDAQEAIRMIKQGMTNLQIAIQLGMKCSAGAIGAIRAGATWRHAWDGEYMLMPSKIGTASRLIYCNPS